MPEQINILLADTCCLFKIGFGEAFRRPEKYHFDKVNSLEEAEIKLTEKKYKGFIFDWDFPFSDYYELRKRILAIQPDIKLITYFKVMTLQIYHDLQRELLDGFFERDLNKQHIEQVIKESIAGNYLTGRNFKKLIPKAIAEIKLKNKALEAFYYLINGYETKEIMTMTGITEGTCNKRNTRLLRRLNVSSRDHLRNNAIENGLIAPCELKRKGNFNRREES